MAQTANPTTAVFQPGSVWAAATTAAPQPAMPPDPACQPCPECGGLECLCRPRFFAGQLLTEQDLNRLDYYITEKSKLHNRYLFGAGVVCGLEVRCHPCGETLSVSPGYALSPCGEDIVVCKTDTVDICSLIAQCRKLDPPQCQPYGGQDACQDLVENWILAIHYREEPSRGATALLGQSCSCKSGCSCGGAGCSSCAGKPACSCGAGATQTAPAPNALPRPRRGAPPSCEPTVTCEGYRYEVFRAPETTPPPLPRAGLSGGIAGAVGWFGGEMFGRIKACFDGLSQAIPALPGDPNTIAQNPQLWFRWCCQMRQAFLTYFSRYGGTQCDLVERLQSIPCPDPNSQTFGGDMTKVVIAYAVEVFEAVLDCLCSAFLPPCRAPADPRVPLALVQVRRSDCHIVSVCNWTPLRKHVVTIPTLGYWLGWIPLAQLLRQALQEICCARFGLENLFGRWLPQQRTTMMATAAETGPGAAGADEGQPGGLDQPISLQAVNPHQFDTTFLEALTKVIGQQQSLRTGDLVNAMLTRPSFAASGATTPEEKAREVDRLAGTGQVKLLGELLRPFSLLLPLAGLDTAPDSAVGPVNTGGLRAELAELRDTVARQQADIERLQSGRQ
jgi:hypothetical protein